MTHAVNLLPWRDLRRRQRLRFILLIATGIMLLGLMSLQVCRTVRLQHLALATLHATADAQLLASLKQRELPMRVPPHDVSRSRTWDRECFDHDVGNGLRRRLRPSSAARLRPPRRGPSSRNRPARLAPQCRCSASRVSAVSTVAYHAQLSPSDSSTP